MQSCRLQYRTQGRAPRRPAICKLVVGIHRLHHRINQHIQTNSLVNGKDRSASTFCEASQLQASTISGKACLVMRIYHVTLCTRYRGSTELA